MTSGVENVDVTVSLKKNGGVGLTHVDLRSVLAGNEKLITADLSAAKKSRQSHPVQTTTRSSMKHGEGIQRGVPT